MNNSVIDKLASIRKSEIIRVGTTGDYKPFSYLDDNNYKGYDIDIANYMAKQLDVQIKFIKTSWSKLLQDIKEDQFDIAVGGITRNISRQLDVEQTQGYITFGKCFLARKIDAMNFSKLDKIDKKEVRVGFNIGGTNEVFARENLQKATFITFENNLEVPMALLEGKIDIMITESVEAIYYESLNRDFKGIYSNNPFTKEQFTYLIAKNQQRFLNTINFILEDIKLKSIDKKFMKNNGLI